MLAILCQLNELNCGNRYENMCAEVKFARQTFMKEIQGCYLIIEFTNRLMVKIST